MHRTIFQTPIVSPLFRAIAWVGMKASGWKMAGVYPEQARRCVIIGAPHTSNWDLPVALMGAFYWRLNIYWLGKDSIFRPPFGGLMRWLGGVAVDRSRSHNMTQAIAAALAATEGQAQLVISPEGTRKRVTEWKTGFYYIALEAQLPIFMAYVDYEKKEIGHFGLFTPTGDVQADLQRIRALYANVKGRIRSCLQGEACGICRRFLYWPPNHTTGDTSLIHKQKSNVCVADIYGNGQLIPQGLRDTLS